MPTWCKSMVSPGLLPTHPQAAPDKAWLGLSMRSHCGTSLPEPGQHPGPSPRPPGPPFLSPSLFPTLKGTRSQGSWTSILLHLHPAAEIQPQTGSLTQIHSLQLGPLPKFWNHRCTCLSTLSCIVFNFKCPKQVPALPPKDSPCARFPSQFTKGELPGAQARQMGAAFYFLLFSLLSLLSFSTVASNPSANAINFIFK